MVNRGSHLKVSALKISTTGLVGSYIIDNITKLRVVVENSGPLTEFVFKGKIKGQSNYDTILTTTGNVNTLISVNFYDNLYVECSNVDLIGDDVSLSFAGFDFIVGAEISDSVVDLEATWSSKKISDTLVGLGDRDVRVTRFETISSGTGGRITIPYDQTVILDDFGGTVDAIVTTIANGRPTYNSAKNIQGEVISTTFDAHGYYTFTSTPSAYPVAIIYRIRQKVSTYVDSDTNIIGSIQYQEVESVNTKTGAVVLTKADVGLSNVDNTSDLDKPISTLAQAELNTKLKIPVPQTIILNSQNILDKFVVLSGYPQSPSNVSLQFENGIPQINGKDFAVTGNVLHWDTLGLEGFIEENDTIYIKY